MLYSFYHSINIPDTTVDFRLNTVKKTLINKYSFFFISLKNNVFCSAKTLYTVIYKERTCVVASEVVFEQLYIINTL